MPRNKDKAKTNRMLDQRDQDIRTDRSNNQSRTRGQRADTDEQVGIWRESSRDDYNRHRDSNYNVGYQDVNLDNVFGPGGSSRGRGGGGGGGGRGGSSPISSKYNVDPTRFKADPNRFSVDPTRFSVDLKRFAVDPRGYNSSIDLSEAKGQYRKFGQTGGIDENRSRVAHGNFQEFAQTGGYSDQDKRDIRSRATSPISSLYSGIRDKSARMSNVQGGYGPGRGALSSRLARDSAGAVGRTSLDAELGIMDRVNEGRRFGASALDTSERGIQSTLQRGRMFGASGLESAGVQDAVIDRANMDRGASLDVSNQDRFSTRELANMGLASSRDVGNMDRASGRDVGNMNRFSGREVGNMNRSAQVDLANAARASAASSAAASRSDANNRFNTGLRADLLTGNANRRGGVDVGNVNREYDRNTSSFGMSNDRYNSERGYNLALTDQELQGQGQGYRGSEGVVDQRMQNNPQRDWIGTVMGGIGAVSGLAGAFGGFGSRRQRQQPVQG